MVRHVLDQRTAEIDPSAMEVQCIDLCWIRKREKVREEQKRRGAQFVGEYEDWLVSMRYQMDSEVIIAAASVRGNSTPPREEREQRHPRFPSAKSGASGFSTTARAVRVPWRNGGIAQPHSPKVNPPLMSTMSGG